MKDGYSSESGFPARLLPSAHLSYEAVRTVVQKRLNLRSKGKGFIMRHKLTDRQSLILFYIILAIIIVATIILGFIINTPTSPGGLLSIGAFVVLLLFIFILFFYYRRKS